MGIAATFSVSASGSSLRYQWSRNGAALAGATASAYTTPATTFEDDGASYRVTITNAGGSLVSSVATLTVTARAPAAGDLRFRLVDAAETRNGWWNDGSGLSTDLPARAAAYYAPAIGSPFYVGSAGHCSPPPQGSCSWFYTEVGEPPAASNPSLIAGYGAGFYQDFTSDLTPGGPSPFRFDNAVTPLSTSSVMNSLDLEPANDLYAVSWAQLGTPEIGVAAPGFAFLLEQNTVSPAALAAAATTDAAAGRVLTAVSANGTQVTYFAYAWQADTSTAYETLIVTASTPGAPAAAAQLAAQGYIITATGQADDAGDLYLVGTRVMGDTRPRPFIAAQGSAEVQTAGSGGYALVGVIVNLAIAANPYSWLFER